MSEKATTSEKATMSESVTNDGIVVEEVTPEVFTLSTGVRVIFNELPTQIAQKALTTVFSALKSRDGKTVTMQKGRELEVIRNMTQYHDTLVLMGVKLADRYEDVVQLYQDRQLEILVGGEIEDELREYYFLRTFGFVTESDFTLLTEQTLKLVQQE